MSRMIRISKPLYARLDKLARAEGGCPLRVRTQKQLPGDRLWAQVVENAWVYQKAGRTEKVRHTVIDVVNEFDLELFHNSIRPEMDYSAIPQSRAYEFLVWHEIGHLTQGIPGTFLIWGWLVIKIDPNLTKFLMELKADRFAWRAMFPHRPLAQKDPAPGNPTVDEISSFYDGHRQVFHEYAQAVSLRPLIAASDEMVPIEHVDPPGIPWAGPDGRLVASLGE